MDILVSEQIWIVNNISDKELISKTKKELIQFNTPKNFQ